MLCIKHHKDIRQDRLPSPLRELVESYFRGFMSELDKLGWTYDPEADGYLACLDPVRAREELLAQTGAGELKNLILENVQRRSAERCFVLAWIPSNSFGITFFLPDAPGLDPELRQWLLAQVDGGEAGEEDAHERPAEPK